LATIPIFSRIPTTKLQIGGDKLQSAVEPSLQAPQLIPLIRRREQVTVNIECDLDAGMPHQPLHPLG